MIAFLWQDRPSTKIFQEASNEAWRATHVLHGPVAHVWNESVATFSGSPTVLIALCVTGTVTEGCGSGLAFLVCIQHKNKSAPWQQASAVIAE
jgi:hypothetical protein